MLYIKKDESHFFMNHSIFIKIHLILFCKNAEMDINEKKSYQKNEEIILFCVIAISYIISASQST